MEASFPHFPRSFVLCPEVFQDSYVTQCVHALPELIVPIGHQLPLGGQSLERLALKVDVVSRNVVKNGWLQDKETAVDPAFGKLGLLTELCDAITLEDQ